MKMPMPKNAREGEMHTPKMKKLPSLSDPKSPAAVSTGLRMHKMPEFPVWGAPAVSKKIKKLPPLCDPKS